MRWWSEIEEGRRRGTGEQAKLGARDGLHILSGYHQHFDNVHFPINLHETVSNPPVEVNISGCSLLATVCGVPKLVTRIATTTWCCCVTDFYNLISFGGKPVFHWQGGGRCCQQGQPPNPNHPGLKLNWFNSRFTEHLIEILDFYQTHQNHHIIITTLVSCVHHWMIVLLQSLASL